MINSKRVWGKYFLQTLFFMLAVDGWIANAFVLRFFNPSHLYRDRTKNLLIQIILLFRSS